MVFTYFQIRDFITPTGEFRSVRTNAQEVTAWERGLTLLVEGAAEALLTSIPTDEGEERRNTESIKFREKIWAPTNRRPKHSRPKVSAVSCIMRRAFNV